jgi:hypothetical protein
MATKKRTPKKSDDVKIQKYQRDLPAALNREEIEERAQMMSRKLSERDAWEVDAKEIAKANRMKLTEFETEIRRLSGAIREREEMRLVDCERRFDYETGRVTDVRLDSGEVLAERDMSEIERQKDLPLGDIDEEFGGSDDAEEDGDE